jgi:cytochrome b561
MRIRNSDTHFGLVAILLHWIIAILIIGLLTLGLYMVDLPISLEKLKLYGWHKEYGLLVLALVIVRLGWRLINITPNLSIPFLEKIAARAVHWAFYVFMFAMPITGWLVTSAAGLPASFFGLFTLPNLIPASQESLIFYSDLHKWLGYGLIATIILHTLAALKHHFINKDDILRRMIS